MQIIFPKIILKTIKKSSIEKILVKENILFIKKLLLNIK